MVDTYTSLPDFTVEAVRQLAEHESWLCWRYVHRRGSEKPTKVPYTVDRRPASTTDPATWGAFHDVYQACVSDEYFSGIGYVFDERNRTVGIDLDGVRDPETGEIEQRARDIVELLDSFTEISPSGTGLHVIVEADYPRGRGRRAGNIEVYGRGRFFTVTGDVLGGRDVIQPRQAELEEFFERYIPRAHESAEHSGVDVGAAGTPAALGEDGFGDDDAGQILRALDENTLQFGRIWRHDYEVDDESLSIFDYRLALFLCQTLYGFDDRFVATAIRRHRLRYGDPQGKSQRQDYLQRTIANARACVAREEGQRDAQTGQHELTATDVQPQDDDVSVADGPMEEDREELQSDEDAAQAFAENAERGGAGEAVETTGLEHSATWDGPAAQDALSDPDPVSAASSVAEGASGERLSVRSEGVQQEPPTEQSSRAEEAPEEPAAEQSPGDGIRKFQQLEQIIGWYVDRLVQVNSDPSFWELHIHKDGVRKLIHVPDTGALLNQMALDRILLEQRVFMQKVKAAKHREAIQTAVFHADFEDRQTTERDTIMALLVDYLQTRLARGDDVDAALRNGGPFEEGQFVYVCVSIFVDYLGVRGVRKQQGPVADILHKAGFRRHRVRRTVERAAVDRAYVRIPTDHYAEVRERYLGELPDEEMGAPSPADFTAPF